MAKYYKKKAPLCDKISFANKIKTKEALSYV